MKNRRSHTKVSLQARLVLITAMSLVGCGVRPSTAPDASTNELTTFASQFDAIASQTEGQPPEQRVATVRASFDARFPGLYADPDSARLDRRIHKALDEFPGIRNDYREVVRRFPSDLAAALIQFRVTFPEFVSPFPIYLTHQLGQRDGGTDLIAGRKVMLFGADVIAQFHNDSSMQPFLEHELFHLEHARHFADCDQLWCPLWQEGLATYAASVMTPGADDHQLLLDRPAAIRAPTDARWGAALCWLSDRFDATDSGSTDAAFSAGSAPPELPSRFGYYVGLRVAGEAARTRGLPAIAGLNDERARPVVAAALTQLMATAHAPCAAPAPTGAATHLAPRPA